jgi:citrate lyase subunit beta/citryl-CoA lyase
MTRLRRSILAVPGSSWKMLEKAAGLPADVVFIDMEDAVSPLERTDETRQQVVRALTELEWKAPTREVRVNDVSTHWCRRDLEVIVTGAREHLHGIVLPKVQDASHVHFVHHLLNQLEAEHGIPGRRCIEAQIETAHGMVEVERIAQASDRIETIVFGPGDYTASLGITQLSVGAIDPLYPGDQWHYALSRILTAARAYGKQAIDGPYTAIKDLDGFREVATRSQRLGFDGKWAVHPDQIAVLNEVYSPSREQFDKALRLVEAYREATHGDTRRGAVVHDGEMIDEASAKMALAIVERGRAAGL